MGLENAETFQLRYMFWVSPEANKKFGFFRVLSLHRAMFYGFQRDQLQSFDKKYLLLVICRRI